jgi:hypothetical protein
VWIQLVRYGLATELYLDLYPLLVRQLLYFLEKLDIQRADDRRFDCDIGCSIFTLLTCILGTLDEKTIGIALMPWLKKCLNKILCRKDHCSSVLPIFID